MRKITDKKLMEYSKILDSFIYGDVDDSYHVACMGIEKIIKMHESQKKEICVNCDEEKETYSICSDCLHKIVEENKFNGN